MSATPFKQNKKGFTLVELLVTVALIAILSTIGFVAYASAQKQARIAKRSQDLKAIQTALELYRSTNGVYPSNVTATSCNTNTVLNWNSECSGWLQKSADQVIPCLVPTYMPVFPSDPSMDKANNNNCYLYMSDGLDYKLLDYRVADMTSAEIQNQKNLVDPARDNGSSACLVDGASDTSDKSWAIWSSCTTSPSCSGSCTW